MNSFEKLLVLLAKNEIRFVTIGGFACVFNGFVRPTEDVDILISGTDSNLSRFLQVMSQYGNGCAAELSVSDFTDEEGAIRIIEDFPIDVFVRVSGTTYEDVLDSIRYENVGGTNVPYLDMERLIEIKSMSLRDIDRIDVTQLRKLSDNKP